MIAGAKITDTMQSASKQNRDNEDRQGERRESFARPNSGAGDAAARFPESRRRRGIANCLGVKIN